MITHNELRKGIRIIIDNEPFEVLESMPLKKAQRRVVIQSKIKNLITGNVLDRNFHQGDVFEEAEILKFEAKYLYTNPERKSSTSNGASGNRYFFCEKENPSKRFDLGMEQIGESAQFLKSNQIIDGLIFDEKVIGVSLPIKVQLKVMEAPPGYKGDRAQSGTKQVTLETGAIINAPLFVTEGDILEINTETGEYVRRLE